jgi:subtilisin family serine protease
LDTYCADAASGFYTLSGTSLSAPLVAGVAAQLLAVHPDWTYNQVGEALMNTASRSTNPDNNYGWGVINATKAMNYSPQGTCSKYISAATVLQQNLQYKLVELRT